MKKILLISFAVVCGIFHGNAQALIQFYSLVADVTTNSTPYAPDYPTLTGTGGKTTAGSAYEYVLLAATSTTGADWGNPLGPDWSVVMDNGTDAVAFGGPVAGSVNGPGGGVGFAPSLTYGTTYFDMIVGWSANLGAWNDVQNLLSSDFADNTISGFVGYSAIGQIAAAPAPNPASPVFGDSPAIPLGSLILYQVPEPDSWALLAYALAAMKFYRLKKFEIHPSIRRYILPSIIVTL